MLQDLFVFSGKSAHVYIPRFEKGQINTVRVSLSFRGSYSTVLLHGECCIYPILNRGWRAARKSKVHDTIPPFAPFSCENCDAYCVRGDDRPVSLVPTENDDRTRRRRRRYDDGESRAFVTYRRRRRLKGDLVERRRRKVAG